MGNDVTEQEHTREPVLPAVVSAGQKGRFRWLAEAALIVVSILLAFGIEAIWDERGQRADELRLLQDLRAELVENRRVLENNRGNHESYARAAAASLAVEYRSGPADSAQVYLLGRLFGMRNTFQPVGGGLSRITQSGDLALISDPDLRSMLADWPRSVTENSEDEIRITNLLDNHLRPFMVRRGVAITLVDAPPRDSWMIDLPDGPPVRLEQVLDEEGRGLLALRISLERLAVRENGRLIEAIDQILARIEVVLGRRGAS